MKNETELLQECKLQLEYLNEKFGETGTTNALLTKLDAVLRQPDVSGRSELLLAFAKYAMPDNYTPLALNNIVKTFLEERKQ